MGDDGIVEFKWGVGPVKLNIVALLRRLCKKAKTDPVAVVAHRFLQLFQQHDIAIPQIPRLVPQIMLENLRSIDSLLSAITSDVLEHTANLFGVRRSWLEGVDDCIYEWRSCYKQPHSFFENLAILNLPSNGFAVRALSTTKALDGQDDRVQPLALVLAEKVQDLENEEVLRYRVYGDAWDWSHAPCRIQLKAIARLILLICGRPVPLHLVKPALLERIIEGKCIPHSALKGCLLTDPSLEDFALSHKESVKAKETDELPAVLDYICRHELETLARLTTTRTNSLTSP